MSLILTKRELWSLSSAWKRGSAPQKPKASEVLSAYLRQSNLPPWTSYFVRLGDVSNDQYGMSSFNWEVNGCNYLVLRVGCWPYVKYHCTRGPKEDLTFQDKFFRFLKAANLGIPCLVYGLVARFLITHKELVYLQNYKVYVYFLIKENLGSRY